MKNSALWLHIKREWENSSKDKTSYLVPISISSKETYGKLHDNSLTTLIYQGIIINIIQMLWILRSFDIQLQI